MLPAYNAGLTLRRTVREIDRSVVDSVLLVDDASDDDTLTVARSLGLRCVVHDHNLGYGGNQKTCYQTALQDGADILVMVHPDYQYSPRLVLPMAAMIASGHYDVVLGSRVLTQNAMAAGMPRYKYVANRVLTFVENMVMHQKLSEYHTGLRAYSADVLRCIPFERNSDDFVFDNQILAQVAAVGARIGELSCPTRYAEDSSSISFSRSARYGVGVLATASQYRMRQAGLTHPPFLDCSDRPGFTPPSRPAARPYLAVRSA
ncbi:MAG TPA: glycosyltransferase family 2 protein [Solirubrobacteraceae bacterium]|nr:glycosyltransferase family 2 protein [Solirubrobacteraceae bacterium]